VILSKVFYNATQMVLHRVKKTVLSGEKAYLPEHFYPCFAIKFPMRFSSAL